jgi:hypothetical protein
MDVVILKFIYLRRIWSSDPRNKGRVEIPTDCISHRLELYASITEQYWMTLRKKRILEIGSTSIRCHSMKNWLWKRLWTCRETDCGMNECLNNMKVSALKERSCRKYECFRTKSKFCEVSDGTLHAGLLGACTCHLLLLQRQRFGNWICCRFRVKVLGGIYWAGSRRKM